MTLTAILDANPFFLAHLHNVQMHSGIQNNARLIGYITSKYLSVYTLEYEIKRKEKYTDVKIIPRFYRVRSFRMKRVCSTNQRLAGPQRTVRIRKFDFFVKSFHQRLQYFAFHLDPASLSHRRARMRATKIRHEAGSLFGVLYRITCPVIRRPMGWVRRGKKGYIDASIMRHAHSTG